MKPLLNYCLACSITFLSINVLANTEPPLSWSPEAILSTNIISEVQISPGNETALLTVVETRLKEDKYITFSRIYKSGVDSSCNAIPFSNEGVSSMQPRWAPDGKSFAFISNPDGIKQLFLRSLDSEDITPLTSGKSDIQTFEWSHDGKKIAFVRADDKSDIKSPYLYPIENRVNRLWVIDVATSSNPARALTQDVFHVRGCGDFGVINTEFDWSPDDSEITFAYSSGQGCDDYHLTSSIATVNLESGKVRAWEPTGSFESMPRYSPDGLTIAYLHSDSPKQWAYNRNIAVRHADGTAPKILAPTFNEGALLAGPNLLGWTDDGKNVLFFEPKGTKYHLVFVPADGSDPYDFDAGDAFIKEPSLSYDRKNLGFVLQTAGTAPEAFFSPLKAFSPIQLSQLNSAFSDLPEIKTEKFVWNSSDGTEIEGLLTYPVDYVEGNQYPLLLSIHGGPMFFFDETFLGTYYPYPTPSFAEAGFFVFRPNPRGSTGYGKDFREAIYDDWGGIDYDDINTGVDAVIATGMVDANRLGVMGWSYGGYMGGYIIGQTSRYKAASLGAGLYNLISAGGTLDIPKLLTDYLGEFPKNLPLYISRSPLHSVENVKTPCLIQHGVADLRVPVGQSLEYYQALKQAGKHVEMHLYPGMAHRFTDNSMKLDLMNHNVEWFRKHLLQR